MKTNLKKYTIAFKDSCGFIRYLDIAPMSLAQAERHRQKLAEMKPGIQFFTVNKESE